MCTRLRSEVFLHALFSVEEFDFERPAAPSDAPGRKRLKAPSVLSRLNRGGGPRAQPRALTLHNTRRGKEQPALVLERQRERERGQACARLRGQHVALVARPDAQGRAWHEGARPRRCGGEAEGGQVMLIEGTPMNREKSGRPGDSLASG
jgi:hypothetical protein